MPRFKNADWDLPKTPYGVIATWQAVEIAVMMDIRDELQTLSRLLGCHNFIRIPMVLDRIVRNTTPKRKPRRKPR